MNYYAEYKTKDSYLLDKYDLLTEAMITIGERLPKKHGAWYRVKTFDDNWLVYDTWNGCVYLYPNGAEPSDTDNMYHVVYVFYDKNGSVNNCTTIKPHMADFWRSHIKAA
jgi:hypothetical protein